MRRKGNLFHRGGCYICHQDVDLTHGLCPHCLASMGLFGQEVFRPGSLLERTYACFSYSDLLKKYFHLFKFQHKTYWAPVFAGFMADCILDRGLDKKIDQVTYIPMEKSRERKRGYNQSKLLAEKIVQILDMDLATCLEKTRPHKAQVGLRGWQRRTNLKDSLQAQGDVEGKSLLLIDDIMTTGATLEEGARALKAGGAKAVYGLVLAVSGGIQK
ncbi:MAG: ComF family protein [Tissierellia bacterium]|nr:ComF family protein [Tissierellia bacterium]